MRKTHVFLLAFTPVFLLSACSTDGGVEPMTNQSQSSSSSALPEIGGSKGSKPTIAAPKGAAPKALEKKDIFVGTGKEAVPTSTLEVHYTLMAWSTGNLVESSWDSGQTATFPLSGVIAGWQQGIPGMKVGGRRKLTIPPEMAYGPAGSGHRLSGKTLVFIIDLLAVS